MAGVTAMDYFVAHSWIDSQNIEAGEVENQHATRKEMAGIAEERFGGS